jgi:hypothetical protein
MPQSKDGYQMTDSTFDADAYEKEWLNGKQNSSSGGNSSSTPSPSSKFDADAYEKEWLKNAPTPPPIADQPPSTTTKGVLKSAAAGGVDAGAGAINMAIDPFGNLIGKPLITLGMAAHDALAPTFGYDRFTDKQRADFLGDEVAQPGTRLANGVGNLLGTPSTDSIQPATDAERMVRKGTTGAFLGGLPGVVGALTGDQLAERAPDWAKPAAELTGNLLGGGVGGAAERSVVTPFTGKTTTMPPSTAALVDLAKQRGIDLPATLVPDAMNTPSKVAYGATKLFPGSGAGTEVARPLNQWHQALAEEVGIPTGKLSDAQKNMTPTALNGVKQNVMDDISDIERNTPFQVSPGLNQKLAQIEKNADVNMTPEQAKIVKQQVDEIRNGPVWKQGNATYRLKQPTYHDVIGDNSSISTGTKNADPIVAQASSDIGALVRNELANQNKPYTELLTKRDNVDALSKATDNSGKVDPKILSAELAGKGTPMESLSQVGQFLNPQKGTWGKLGDKVSQFIPGFGGELAGLAVTHAATGLGGKLAPVVLPATLAARGAGKYYRSKGYMNNVKNDNTTYPGAIGGGLVAGDATDSAEIPTMTIKPTKKKTK